jgi:hypothetical protein
VEKEKKKAKTKMRMRLVPLEIHRYPIFKEDRPIIQP